MAAGRAATAVAVTAAAIDLGTRQTHERHLLTRSISRPRRLAGAAALLVSLLAMGACAPAAAPTASQAGSPSRSAPAPGATEAASDSASAASTATASRLAAAFAAMADGYTFTSNVTVGAATVSTAEGRSVGGASEFVLTSAGKSVTYRAVPPKAWVQQSGGAWVVVSGKVPPGSPIAGLTSPTTITVIGDDADALSLDTSYPAAALGLAGDTAVRVHLVVARTGVVTATYEAAVGTDQAASTSVFTPASDLTPIAAPSP